MSRVVVVGSGVGGLSAAARLAARGHEVTVCEQADVVGGKLGRLERHTSAGTRKLSKTKRSSNAARKGHASLARCRSMRNRIARGVANTAAVVKKVPPRMAKKGAPCWVAASNAS